MEFAKTSKAIGAFLERMTQLMKLELGTYKNRPRRSSKWKNGKPVSTKTKMRKGRTDASGNLRKSIDYNVNGLNGEITMLEYGLFVEQGRKPGKGIPVEILQKWIVEKNIKPRENNKFVKRTPERINSMSFVMNRSIKAFGIAPNPFIEPSQKRALDEHRENIIEALKNDIIDNTDKGES